ncbi:epidermal retinol dehydrogenase 2-like [Paramacrobiotus metropolitanus]|uniref:epidermal retinol dehydrogenase 2-like n=1 Tax=Paramacrobiotus metropolitanus TaxID=2943436 RepID=UPI002446235A|nr:epidermal retinol dehydrogenase 2-like [Paramacrobiotus metropolitanus]
MHIALRIILALLEVVYAYLEALIFLILPTRFRKHKSIAGEIALVTGAGSGIGRLMALRLSRLGASLVLWDVSEAGLDETRRIIENDGGPVRSYLCDVSDRQMVYDVAERVRREVGNVTILVNNAGIVNGKWFLETADERLEKTMQVNAVAHFWTVKAFLPSMISNNHGHIVTISSMAGRFALPRLVDYCASKFAATGFHESLQMELELLGKTAVKMTNVQPFFITTGMFTGVETSINPWVQNVMPLLSPDYVADTVVEAILLNKPEVMIPRSMYIMMRLAVLMPKRAMRALEDLMESRDFMAGFVGRELAGRPAPTKRS